MTRHPLLTGRAVRRGLRRHRRSVAAVLTALAVLSAVRALAPSPPPTAAVAVAARDLPAGARLAAADVRTVDLPPEVVPAGAIAPRPGTVLAVAIRRGEPFTDVRLANSAGGGRPAGSVVLTVRTADAAGVLAVRPGDLVDVLAGPIGGEVGAAAGALSGDGSPADGSPGDGSPGDGSPGAGSPGADAAGAAVDAGRWAAETLARGALVLRVPGRESGGSRSGAAGAGTGSADGSAGGAEDGLPGSGGSADDAGLLGGLDAGVGSAPADVAGVLVLAADRAAAARIAAAVPSRPLTVTVVSP